MRPRPRARWLTFGLALLATVGSAPRTGGRADAPTPGAASLVVNLGLDVRTGWDEAEAALAIIEKRRAGREPSAADWGRLFQSEGYRRLKEREQSMGRAFEDSTFRAFLLSDSVAAAGPKLASTLADWRHANLSVAAQRALTYLPAGAPLRATLYPVVKPRSNSFVFDTRSNPAIFLFLDPGVSRAKLENTLAHELHHIGYAGACKDDADSTLAEPAATVALWAGAFGEGLAMLAAAGGPAIHPHATSEAAERERWDRDVARFDEDMGRIEAFFLDVLDGRLTDPDSIQARAMEFFGVQGPWYTVGWKMAVTIEETYGRARLIEVLCDPRRLLAAYNAAATERNRSGSPHPPLPLWSPSLLQRLGL